MGAAIHPHARKLVGVDLSARMLTKAGERSLYQRLEKSDLLTMMKNEAASSYDLIVAADVFVYIGKLDEIVGEGARLLRPGAGLLAFSVEALESSPNGGDDTNNSGYKLNANGRYAHSSAYLRELARTHGFSVSALARNSVRLEKGKPVEGWFALLERAP